jgi:polyisoprenoid-binding protein YceI
LKPPRLPASLYSLATTLSPWPIAILSLLFLAPRFSAAQEVSKHVLELDSARSAVDFEVKVLWLVGVHGRFNRVQGAITVDPFHNSVTVDARIDASAVSMRSHSHEEWVKSPEFFDAAHYPEIHFVSDPVPLKRLQTGGEIDGTLTLRGINKPVRFQIAVPTCPGASGEDCPVEAEGSIRRSDFGMSSRRGTLSDKVDLGFTIYVVPAKSDAAR